MLYKMYSFDLEAPRKKVENLLKNNLQQCF